MIKKFLPILFFLFFISCQQNSRPAAAPVSNVVVPAFSADSAYLYVKHQVDFGPRVPNTPAHRACAAYLTDKLESFGAVVYNQNAQLTAFDGTKLNAFNIIGSFLPEQKNRILLISHWDSRPWADQDPNTANHKKAVTGANDGASGVGVLLEIARQLGLAKPDCGVDILLVDAEDYGAPQNYQANTEDSWCLGTQYWTKNPHITGYKANFGILLDMVGAPDATFMREQISEMYASNVVDKIWNQAASLGFGKYFINERGGGVTDDHLYINRNTGIPTVDIIHYNPQNRNGFGDYWHTVNDDMNHIDRNTLFSVGTTLLEIIYHEK